MSPAAVVLVSGGIDSAVALYWARSQGWRPTVLTFDYAGRPRREVEATARLADLAGVEEVHRVPLPWMREAVDLPPELRRNPALEKAPEGYIPVRNLAFYAIAAHYAEVIGARRIVAGHHGRDAERFPDASRPFFDAFERAAELGMLQSPARPLRVELPLLGLDKEGVLELGFSLGVPYEDTWSCYEADRATPCGGCAPCVERAIAFESVGRTDPLLA